MKHDQRTERGLITSTAGNGMLAGFQGILLLLGIFMLFGAPSASAGLTGYVFTDADAGGPDGATRAIGGSDVVYRYDVATDSVSVVMRPAEFLTPAGKKLDPVQISALHLGETSSTVYFSITGEATLPDGTLVTAGDVLIYDAISGAVQFHEGIRGLNLEAKGIDGLYVFENGPEVGKVLLSLSSNGNFTYPNPNTVNPYDTCGNKGDGATCSFNSRGQDVIEFDPALRHPTIRFDAGTGILVDAVHIMDTGEIAISCESRKCDVGGTVFDENDIIKLTLDDAGSALSGEAILPTIGDLYTDASVNIDGFSVYGDFLAGPPTSSVDHFEILDSSTTPASECSPASITIRAVDAAGTLVTDYAGTITLATSTKHGRWAATGSAKGTFAPSTTATSEVGNGEATYTFDATGDAGSVTLTLSHPATDAANQVNIDVADAADSTVIELAPNDPSISFSSCLDHFTIVKDANEAPSACSPATITISAVDARGNLITDYAGTINLSTSTLKGDWALKAAPATDPATAPATTNLKAGAGDGTATYTFNGAADGDGGQVILSLDHPQGDLVDINVTDGATPAVTERSGTGPTIGADNHVSFSACENTIGPDHFVIEHTGQGINCTPSSITIRAVDASGATLTNYDGSIRLTTSTNLGDWSKTADGGTGEFVAGAADSGSAGYTFTALDQGAVTLQLAYVYEGEISINVTDGIATERSNGATLADDPALTFVRAGLRFCEFSNGTCNPISTQISGKPSDTAPTRGPLYVQAVGTAADGSCEALCSGTVEVQMAYDCVDPNTCATPALAVNNTRVTERQKVVAGDFTRVPMDFGTGSDHAPFTMNYRDAGKIRLYAKIPASASTPASCQTTIARSNDLVVRPFTLGFADVKAGATVNPEGNASSGAGFVSAGTEFGYTLSGLQWQAADDANNDGHADAGANLGDNPVAPNFKDFTQTVTLAVASTTPTPIEGGVAGALGGPQAISGAGFTAGSATVAGQTYAEVGSLRLEAGLNGYLGTRGADIRGLSSQIGRFYPDRIAVNGSVDTTTCGFAYMDQPAIDTLFTLRAENAFGDATENYDPGRNYLYTGTVEGVLEDSDDGINRFNRTDIDVTTGLSWNAGLASHGGFAQTFARSAAPDGPFQDIQMGLILTEPHNVPLVDLIDGSGADMNADSAGACGATCNAKKIGSPIKVLYGRATISGTVARQTSATQLPAAAEYYDGSSFVTNTQDSCSAWTGAQIDLRFADDDVNPNDSSDPALGVTTVGVDSGSTTATIGNTTLVSGNPAISLSAPGSRNTGTVLVKLDVTTQPWFLFNWGTADGNPPEAEVIFGRRRGDDQVIYWNERF